MKQRAPDTHLAYHALSRALQADGCPICRLATDAVRHYFDTLLYEAVNALPTREATRHIGGECHFVIAEETIPFAFARWKSASRYQHAPQGATQGVWTRAMVKMADIPWKADQFAKRIICSITATTGKDTLA